jgi:hypothetical protein
MLPVMQLISLFIRKNSCSMAQGIWLRAFEFARVSALDFFSKPVVSRNSLFISLLEGSLGAETGWT